MDHGIPTSRPLIPPVATAALLCCLMGVACLGCAGGDLATAKAGGSCGVRAPDGVTNRSGRAWFVQAESCSAGTGSVDRPFNRIQDALSAAKTGDAIVLGDVRLREEVRLPAGVDLFAAKNGSAKLVEGARLVIVGDDTTTVRGLVIEQASGVGITASAGRLWLEDVTIRGTRATAEQGGHGLAVSKVSQLTLVRTKIVDNQGVGVLAKGGGRVSIIEPIYLPTARNLAGKYGIIEPIYLPSSQITGNGTGGIAIIEPIYYPAGTPNLRLESTLVRGNGGFGVGLWAASARVVNSAIVDTKVGAQGPWADGVMLAAGRPGGEAVAVQIDARSVVSGNARTGVAMLARATLQAGADISKNKLCGVWAGDASVVTISGDAAFSANTLVGVAVAEGADLRLDGALVAGTVAQELPGAGDDTQAGDGVGVFDGARATIRNARLQNNARAGIIIDKPKQLADGSPDVIVQGSVVSGGKYAVVVNGSPAPSFDTDNTYQSAADAEATDAGSGASGEPGSGFAGSGAQPGGGSSGPNRKNDEPPKDKGDAKMPVKKQVCDDAASCAPSF